MKYFIFCFFYFISICANAQDIKLTYSKGASNLFFDSNSKTEKLSNHLGLSLVKTNNEFHIGYSSFTHSYDGQINQINDIYKNYITNVSNVNIGFNRYVGAFENINLKLGIELGYSTFSTYSNLLNPQGLSYIDYDYNNLSQLGYFSENDFETNMSDANIDQLDDYKLNFFNLGPYIEMSYKIVENFEVCAKTIYRKNTSDLLDNISVNNIRNVSSSSKSDNQIDLLLGIKFKINKSKGIDNDSLVSLIDSITSLDQSTSDNNTDEFFETNDSISSVENQIINKKDYILGFFDFEEENNNSDDIIFDNRKLFSDESDFNNDSKNQDDLEINQNPSLEENNNDKITSQNYLIVGVFSIKSNMTNYAASLKVDSSNFLIRNNMYYLYVAKSETVNEMRQLRDSLEYESWVLSVN